MKKILITGGAGFIGRNLVEQLTNTNDYKLLYPSESELDLLDENSVKKYLQIHQFDVVIHTAIWNDTRNSLLDRSNTLDHNLRMFFNLIRCNKKYSKLIYYGSGAEYNRLFWQSRMSEKYFDEAVPTDAYGFSKYIMSKQTEYLSNIYNLRLFGVFGRYEDWEIRFISNAICKVLYGLPITIKQNVCFDYLYIDDLVRITTWFLENEPFYKIYNVCTGKTYDLYALAEKVRSISGKHLDILVAQEGLGREYSGNNQRLLDEMGGYQFEAMDLCIEKLYNWYQLNKQNINQALLLRDK